MKVCEKVLIHFLKLFQVTFLYYLSSLMKFVNTPSKVATMYMYTCMKIKKERLPSDK